MRLHILGSSGAEALGRNLPAFLVDQTLLLDAGTIGLALRAEDQNLIEDIFLTHAHLDHVIGLPFFADDLVTRDLYRTVSVRSTDDVLGVLKEHLFNGLLWPDFSCIPTPEKPVLRFEAVSEGKAIQLKSHRVTAYHVNHSRPAIGFLIEDQKGKRILYSGDTGPTDRIWTACRGRPLDAVIVEVTYPNRLTGLALQSGHLTPELLKTEFTKMEIPPRRVFISHSNPFYLDEISGELDRIGWEGIEILQDGQVVNL